MRRAALFLALALTFIVRPALATEKVTDFVLDNGMQVVVIEDHRAPLAVHMVWYRAGSADERPGASGAAHFLEHMMFRGTETRAPGEFSERVAANGGNDNAFTSYDYTAYFQRVAADRLGLMMEMEADRMANLLLRPELVETERGVILEERNQRVENEPGSLFREQTSAAQFLNHPYGAPIIGWRHEIEALSREDLNAYYTRHYAPNNAILIVAGDVTPDEVRRLAETHYGPIPANPAVTERARQQEPPQRAPRRVTMEDARVAQPYVTRSWLAPERDPGDQRQAAALVLLSELLGGGQTSVLTTALQYDNPVAVFTSAFYGATSLDRTRFGVVVVPAQGIGLAEAEAALDAEIARFLETGVDAEALERIKFGLKASRIYQQDNVQSVAQRYGRALTSGLALEDIAAWPGILDSITGEEIMAVARDVLVPERSVTGWLRAPEADKTANTEVMQ